jgi:hypothetical protein
MSERVFRDRRDAGQVLTGLLEHYRGREGVVVLGLPRGGVPVAYEVARALGAPLDVFVVRKLGMPGQEKVAMGAILPAALAHSMALGVYALVAGILLILGAPRLRAVEPGGNTRRGPGPTISGARPRNS